jgi:WD40 repeat protein
MVYIYNSTTPYTLITSFNAAIGTGSTTIDYSFDGTCLLICGGNTNTAKVFNLTTTVTLLTTVSFNNAQTCKFAANSNFAIASITGSTFRFYSLTGGLVWNENYNNCLDIDFDGTSSTVVMSCNNGANRRAFAMDTATQFPTNPYTGAALMRTAQISPDGTYVAYSGD